MPTRSFPRCPSRACPNPDVVKPAWEKPDKDKIGDVSETASRIKRNNLKRRRRPRSKVKEATAAEAAAAVVSATTVVESTVMNRTSSLLRDALLGGPRGPGDAVGQRRQLVQRPRQDQPPPALQQAPSPESGQRQVIVMLTPTYSTLPTSIALPQTPVPLSQLTATTTTNHNSNNNNNINNNNNNDNNNSSIHDNNQISNTSDITLNSVSSMTPPFSSGSSSASTTRDNSDDIMDDLMNIDDSMLFEMMDPKRLSEMADTRDLPCKPAALTSAADSPLTLPLLDQSDDPCLNEGDSLSFVTDELDETVQKWMETCELPNFLPI